MAKPGNKETDPGIINFIKNKGLYTKQPAQEILDEAIEEYPGKENLIPRVRQIQRLIAPFRKPPKEGDEWKSEPFSLGALFANEIEVPSNLVNALFSAQLQSQFCSQPFTNNDAKWLIRLKGFYDSFRGRRIKNSRFQSMYGLDGLCPEPPVDLQVTGTLQPANDYPSTFEAEATKTEKAFGWDSRSVAELIMLAKTYSVQEIIFDLENSNSKKVKKGKQPDKFDTRLLDSLVIWKAVPGIGQFLAASSKITGRPFSGNSQTRSNLDRNPKETKNIESEKDEITSRLSFDLNNRSTSNLVVDLNNLLVKWAVKNEQYLMNIASDQVEFLPKDRQGLNPDEIDDAVSEGLRKHFQSLELVQRFIYQLFNPSVRYENSATTAKVEANLSYKKSVPPLSASIDDGSNIVVMALALEFLCHRAPKVFDDLPNTLHRLFKIMMVQDESLNELLALMSPLSYRYGTETTDGSLTSYPKLRLEDLCIEFEDDIIDWQPRSSIIRGSKNWPFIMGLEQYWAMHTGEFQQDDSDYWEFRMEDINDGYEQVRLKEIYQQQKGL